MRCTSYAGGSLLLCRLPCYKAAVSRYAEPIPVRAAIWTCAYGYHLRKEGLPGNDSRFRFPKKFPPRGSSRPSYPGECDFVALLTFNVLTHVGLRIGR